MTTSALAYPQGDASYVRGWMVRNNGAGNWWHTGSFPGTTTIMVRTVPSRDAWVFVVATILWAVIIPNVVRLTHESPWEISQNFTGNGYPIQQRGSFAL